MSNNVAAILNSDMATIWRQFPHSNFFLGIKSRFLGSADYQGRTMREGSAKKNSEEE